MPMLKMRGAKLDFDDVKHKYILHFDQLSYNESTEPRDQHNDNILNSLSSPDCSLIVVLLRLAVIG